MSNQSCFIPQGDFKVINMSVDIEEVIKQATQVLEHIANDNSVPRNIRRSANEVLSTLRNEGEPLFLRTASSISDRKSVV